jgi:hypothetical protein
VLNRDTSRYPHRVNARLDNKDFETLNQIARSLIPVGKIDLTEALRHLLRTWRTTAHAE